MCCIGNTPYVLCGPDRIHAYHTPALAAGLVYSCIGACWITMITTMPLRLSTMVGDKEHVKMRQLIYMKSMKVGQYLLLNLLSLFALPACRRHNHPNIRIMGSRLDGGFDFDHLVGLISQAMEALDDSQPDQSTQKRLSQTCEQFSSRLQSPTKRIEDLTYGVSRMKHVHRMRTTLISVSKWVEIAAVKIAIDMGIFDMAANSPNAEEGFTATEIAVELGSDAVLVREI